VEHVVEWFRVVCRPAESELLAFRQVVASLVDRDCVAARALMAPLLDAVPVEHDPARRSITYIDTMSKGARSALSARVSASRRMSLDALCRRKALTTAFPGTADGGADALLAALQQCDPEDLSVEQERALRSLAADMLHNHETADDVAHVAALARACGLDADVASGSSDLAVLRHLGCATIDGDAGVRAVNRTSLLFDVRNRAAGKVAAALEAVPGRPGWWRAWLAADEDGDGDAAACRAVEAGSPMVFAVLHALVMGTDVSDPVRLVAPRRLVQMAHGCATAADFVARVVAERRLYAGATLKGQPGVAREARHDVCDAVVGLLYGRVGQVSTAGVATDGFGDESDSTALLVADAWTAQQLDDLVSAYNALLPEPPGCLRSSRLQHVRLRGREPDESAPAYAAALVAAVGGFATADVDGRLQTLRLARSKFASDAFRAQAAAAARTFASERERAVQVAPAARDACVALVTLVRQAGLEPSMRLRRLSGMSSNEDEQLDDSQKIELVEGDGHFRRRPRARPVTAEIAAVLAWLGSWLPPWLVSRRAGDAQLAVPSAVVVHAVTSASASAHPSGVTGAAQRVVVARAEHAGAGADAAAAPEPERGARRPGASTTDVFADALPPTTTEQSPAPMGGKPHADGVVASAQEARDAFAHSVAALKREAALADAAVVAAREATAARLLMCTRGAKLVKRAERAARALACATLPKAEPRDTGDGGARKGAPAKRQRAAGTSRQLVAELEAFARRWLADNSGDSLKCVGGKTSSDEIESKWKVTPCVGRVHVHVRVPSCVDWHVCPARVSRSSMRMRQRRPASRSSACRVQWRRTLHRRASR
jgi:hypothetical protein